MKRRVIPDNKFSRSTINVLKADAWFAVRLVSRNSGDRSVSNTGVDREYRTTGMEVEATNKFERCIVIEIRSTVMDIDLPSPAEYRQG
jgi:hypothetical protein